MCKTGKQLVENRQMPAISYAVENNTGSVLALKKAASNPTMLK
jgi:hypothetical protein